MNEHVTKNVQFGTAKKTEFDELAIKFDEILTEDKKKTRSSKLSKKKIDGSHKCCNDCAII